MVFFDGPLNLALKKILNGTNNSIFADIGTINELRIEDKTLNLSINIKGITEEISIISKSIKPASDNSYVELSDFSCNIEGIEAALNMLQSIKVPIPEGAARLGVGAAKLFL
ncbi:MAG: hypothetical protein IJT59_05425 [Desulfovibrionaceae bacterium]|nr:hypothetical protein [Desulfovibrionaceae bacterium]